MGNKKVGRILISDFGALADQQYSTRMQRLLIGYGVVKLKPGRIGAHPRLIQENDLGGSGL